MGESGRSAIKLLSSVGAYVYFFDDDISYAGQVGYVRHIEKEKFDYVIVSPGVKLKDNKNFEVLKNSKAKILSELDLGYLFCKGKILAVTGTNGKTTTCMLLAKILKEAGYKTFLCGNIGIPISSIALSTDKDSVVVCEVSSFQLESSSLFSCDVGAVLNVMPDHIDRHGSFREYLDCKASLLKRCKFAVLNLDDEYSKNIKNCKKIKFFSKKTLKKGVFIKNNVIFNEKKAIMPTSDIKLLGEKNLENVLATVAILDRFEISGGVIREVVASFSPAPHRLEIVGQYDGILYVDDSKATNVASTLNALSAFKNRSIILLLGGKGKDISYGDIYFYRFKEVICFGADGEKIFKSCQIHGANASIFKTLGEATNRACDIAKNGDVVLLSPACSSFDEFTSYRERGDKFKEIVLEKISDKK